mgnify:CR=1 FL=1
MPHKQAHARPNNTSLPKKLRRRNAVMFEVELAGKQPETMQHPGLRPHPLVLNEPENRVEE